MFHVGVFEQRHHGAKLRAARRVPPTTCGQRWKLPGRSHVPCAHAAHREPEALDVRAARHVNHAREQVDAVHPAAAAGLQRPHLDVLLWSRDAEGHTA